MQMTGTMSPKTLMSVRDTARLLGVHENTVRNWEAKGLLQAAGRLPGSGYRRFDRHQVERMRDEMWTQLAPATPEPEAEHRLSGVFVPGDD
jgi:MerR HTH family regulatory protein